MKKRNSLTDPPELITFLAAFPGRQSDIQMFKDGMRITLDIPLTEVLKALPLVRLTETVLEVTVKEH